MREDLPQILDSGACFSSAHRCETRQAARDAVHRAANQQIGNEREREGHEKGFARIEPL